MNKVGYIISLVGGVLAVFLSVMLIVAGPVLTLGPDVKDFFAKNEDNLFDMWVKIGEFNGVEPFLRADFDEYVGDYADIIEDLDARDLNKMADQYDSEAFADLANIFDDNEDYLPKLQLGVIGCIIASVIALIGTELARRHRIVGGAMVLAGAALTLVFSLVGGAIIPMAAASVVLILGGILQILPPSAKAVQKAAQKPRRQIPALHKAAFGLGFVGSVLCLIFAFLMILTVPLHLVSGFIEDIKDDVDNAEVVALNETALALQDEDIDVSNEEAVTAFATDEVAPDSVLVNDEDVYEDVIGFVYKIGAHAFMSMIIVGVAVVLALIAFIGALISRRAPVGGGIMMLFCALATVLTAIYTDTLMPMVIASGLLAIAAILALFPPKMPIYAQPPMPHMAPPPMPQMAYTPPEAIPPGLPDYDVPGDVPFPDAVPDVPEVAPDVPEVAPDVPEVAPDVPEVVPDAPEDDPYPPVEDDNDI